MDCRGVFDMVMYENRLIFYTRDSGLFELDVNAIPLSVQTVDSKPDVTIYPNPVRNSFWFNTKARVECIEMMDATGRVIQRIILSEDERAVNVSQLSKGIYFAVLHTDEQKIIKKIVIND
jgi:hypothetical protein